MIESLNTIRSLGLAPVFEDLYFGRPVPADLDIYMRYPDRFHGWRLEDGDPLTKGVLIPIADDGSFYNIYFYDPVRHKFVVKFLEEPDKVEEEFDNWQQFLAYKLLEIVQSGPTDDELRAIAEVIGFKHTQQLFSLFEQMEGMSDSGVIQLDKEFIRACTD
jgi:hypothetical protein